MNAPGGLIRRASIVAGTSPSGGSLARRLVWLAVGWCVAILIVAGIALSVFFHQAAVGRMDTGLAEITDGLFSHTTVSDGQVFAPPLTDARAQNAYSGNYWQVAEIAPDGRRLTALVWSRSLWDTLLNARPDGIAALKKTGTTVHYDVKGPSGQQLRVLATSALIQGRPLIFMAAEDRRAIDRDSSGFALVTAITLVLMAVGLASAVFLQVRIGLGPLYAMGREIAAVRQGKAQRLSQSYPAELAPLAGELNALLDHNQEVVERQRTHVGNLAHALKTPISVMLTEAERSPGALAAVVTRQAEAMRNHVEHHLRRARAAARTTGSGERTPVAEVLDELSRTLGRIFRGQVEIDWDAPDELDFAGERQDLLEIAGNVLENACKWSRGRVRVAAAPLDDDPRRFRLTVEDDGPGLPPDQREAVLKRGARLDETAPGSGLGLSIVDELARAYGGVLTLSDSSLGGLKIILDLPRAEL